jgi:hypothetical protein
VCSRPVLNVGLVFLHAQEDKANGSIDPALTRPGLREARYVSDYAATI